MFPRSPWSPPSLALVLHSSLLFSSSQALKIAFITDTHIGEGCHGDLSLQGCKPVKTLTDAVSYINTISGDYAIDGVLISGDITSSALYEEFLKVREILDELTVPWWPLLGNHDSWPYTKTGDTFNQTKTPVGDQYFAEIFGDILRGDYNTEKAEIHGWPTSSCLNGMYGFDSWFHNFEISFPQFSDSFKILGLDWVSRGAALPEPGVGPEAEIHEFPCGTLEWFDNELNTLHTANPSTKLFIAQHHPFHNRDILDPFGNNLYFNFTFDKYQDRRIEEIMSKYFPVTSYLGVQAGHMHRWYNGTAFTKYTAITEGFKKLPEWETPACKGWWINEDFVSAFQVFTFVSDSKGDVSISNVEGLWRVPPEGKWEVKPPVSNSFWGH